MTRIVFVHGMNALAGSWNGVENDLSGIDPGYEIVPPIQLPYRDAKGNLAKMADWLAVIDSVVPDGEKAALIGHSMGGAVMSFYANMRPQKVKRLIYVAAMLPAAGDSIRILANRSGAEPTDIAAEFERFPGAVVQLTFAQSMVPYREQFLPSDPFKSLPKHYLTTAMDKILKPKLQASMIEQYTDQSGFPDVVVTPLNTGHLPQYEDKPALAAALKGTLA